MSLAPRTRAARRHHETALAALPADAAGLLLGCLTQAHHLVSQADGLVARALDRQRARQDPDGPAIEDAFAGVTKGLARRNVAIQLLCLLAQRDVRFGVEGAQSEFARFFLTVGGMRLYLTSLGCDQQRAFSLRSLRREWASEVLDHLSLSMSRQLSLFADEPPEEPALTLVLGLTQHPEEGFIAVIGALASHSAEGRVRGEDWAWVERLDDLAQARHPLAA